MRIHISLLCLCCLTSLAAAPLPDTKALWQACQQKTDNSEILWREAISELNDQITCQVLRTDPQFCELCKKYDAAKAELKAAKNKVLASPELKTLLDKRSRAGDELMGISPDDNRRLELTNKRRQEESFERQINLMLQNDPDYNARSNTLLAIRNDINHRAAQLIADSALPVAKVFRDTRQLSPNYFATDNYLLIVDCNSNAPGNPFAGLYDTITYERAKQERVLGFHDYAVNAFKSENPDADPQKIDQYVTYLEQGYKFAAPDGNNSIFLQRGAAPFDELYNIVAAYKLKLQKENDAVRRLTELSNRLPRPSLTRFYALDLLADVTTDKDARSNRSKRAFNELENYLLAGKANSDNSPFLYNYYSASCTDDDWLKMEKALDRIPHLDPWFKQMTIGRAALIKAWKYRGGGWGFTVGKEGSEGLHRELAVAQAAFEEALKLKPDFPQPYSRLIPIAMASCNNNDDQIEIFRKLIKMDPFNKVGYNQITLGLLPRWGGSLELILQLGDTALDYPYYDTVIPAYGFDMMGHVAYYYPDYRWKNIYLRDGIIEKGDRLFATRAGQRGSKSYMLYHRALFEMATLRYERAANTVIELGGEKKFAELYHTANWKGSGTTNWFPRVPAADNFAPDLLRLFTGPDRQYLQDLEKRYLGGQNVSPELLAYIKKSKLSPGERDALLSLYAHWSMDFSIEDYVDCQGNLINILQAAGSEGYPEIFKTLMELGYDYKQYESYPGETAVWIARRSSEPMLLDALKQAGDPLNRQEPKYKHAPIHAAAVQGNAEMIQKLLSLGVPPDTLDGDNHTALQSAAAYGGVEAVKLLLAAGADPDKRDNDGDVALFFVMEQNGPPQIWEMLIKSTKDINICDNSGQNVLHHAAEFLRKPDAIRALLAAGANPNKKDNNGNTPADLAHQRGRADLADILDGKQK